MNDYESIRTTPHSTEAEQSVLGALMLDPSGIDAVSRILSEGDFYREDHQLIYRAITSLKADSKQIDWLTISEYLKDRSRLDDAGGTAYIGTIAKDTPSAANVKGYAKIVRDKYILRELIATGSRIQEKAYSSDGESARDQMLDAQDSIVQLVQGSRDDESKSSRPKDLLRKLFDNWQRQNTGDNQLLGVTTGYAQLDAITQGYGDGWLVVVGARPKMGKTSFMISSVLAALRSGGAVIEMSMEMPEDEIVQRYISCMSGVSLDRVRNAKRMTEEDFIKVTAAAKEFQTFKYFVDDTGGQTPQGIRESVIKKNAECLELYGHKASLITVDYLQIMRSDKKHQNRTGEVTEFSAELKRLAKDMKTPVMALSQLNRSLEQRPNKRPIMSDLRESGAIEQDADLIIFLYRDEVYNEDTEDKARGELIIGAFRHGAPDTVMAGWEGACTRWYDYEPEVEYYR